MNVILLSLLVIATYQYCDCEPIKVSYSPLIPSESYTHTEYIDEDDKDQYRIFWKLLNDDEIQFEVHCRTTGWVGLGISPNGGMTGSDISIGWVADGIPYLKDTHATRRGAPTLDSEQNVKLIDGAEVNGYTILKFKRKLLTCDKTNDREITGGTVYMIFAWNNIDPTCTDWKYHGSNRRTKSILLLSYKNENSVNLLPDDTQYFDMKMRNVQIMPKNTYYYCDIYELPVLDKKYHVIQYEILVQKENRRFIHHLLAYECDDGFDGTPYIGGKECGSAGLPTAVSSKCMTKMFVAWGIGGQYNYSFPIEAGYSVHPKKKKFVLIEIHYDNPTIESGRFDSSGIRFYATPTLRKYDLGLLTFGVNGNQKSIQIPAQTDELKIKEICYPQCIDRFIPDEGVYVISGFLHAHLAGRSMRTSLVRNGKIIKHLIDSPTYDFNYQYANDIEPTKLMKGDALITECTYSTMDRTQFTTFGFSTNDEMCYSFLYYYPEQPAFVQCFSPFTDQSISNLYKSLANNSLLSGISFNPLLSISTNINNIFQALKNFIPSSPDLVQKFKEYFSGSKDRNIYCGSSTHPLQALYIPNVKEYTPENAVPEKVCDPAKYEIPTC